jgi:DNA replication protein DnaC
VSSRLLSLSPWHEGRTRKKVTTALARRHTGSTLCDRDLGACLRGLDRRTRNARLGHFKPLADYDWLWPEKIERHAIECLMKLDFLERPENVLLVGGIGLGKTMIASNIAYAAIGRDAQRASRPRAPCSESSSTRTAAQP